MRHGRKRSRHGPAPLFCALTLALISACGDSTPPEGDAGGVVRDATSDVAADALLDGCVPQPFASDQRDIDILFVVSSSSSMSTIDDDGGRNSRWDEVASALRTFVTGLAGQRLGAGMLFFPLIVLGGDGGTPVEACAEADYSAPDVPIVPLEADGAQAMAFDAALAARSLQGGNTIAAALAGALKHAARAKGMTGHVVKTVLVTDDAVDPCGAAIADAAAVAGEAFRTYFLETYVLGVGPAASRLDPIAVAGGTFRTYAASDREPFASALATMGVAMRRCDFYFPMILSTSDFLRVVMTIDDGKSSRQPLPRFDGGADCANGAGWFYNSNLAPAYAIFCPSTCDALLQNRDREVSALLSCW
jgi:hypothetical protein